MIRGEQFTKLEIEEMRHQLWYYLYDGTWDIDDLCDLEVIEAYRAVFEPEDYWYRK